MSSDTVEQIKSRLDIADVVSSYLKLQKSGSGWKARCPFHSEKTPSFHVSPERQSWHCFGCNKGGDMFSFVQEVDGLDFPEALRVLAARAGVQLPERGADDRAQRQERRRLLEVLALSEKFFVKQLWHGPAGAKALAYLRGRGMADATIEAWKLGWAPNDWRALTGFLRTAGVSDNDIVAAGMAVQKIRNSLYDRFRSRIMFPIADAGGSTVGFTGRAFGAVVAPNGEAPAKYVNTPQTPVYDKSRVVFGLHLAKAGMRQRDAALLVEGNMDAIMAWQAGATHAVAVSGTALTPHQLRMIGRHTMNLDMCFDRDQAGQTATRRGIGLALAADMNVRVLALDDPECKDPADYVGKHGGEKFTALAGSAVGALQYYYDRAKENLDPSSPASKRAAIASLGPLIRRLASKVEQSHWIGELAMLLRTDHASVTADVAAAKDDIAAAERGPDEEAVQPAAAPLAPPDPASAELAAILARDPALAAQAAAWLDLADARVAALIREPAQLTSTEAPAELRPVIEAAHRRSSEFYSQMPPARLAAALEAVGAHMRERALRGACARLEFDIQAAERQGDADRVRKLVQEFQSYTEEIARLRSIQSTTAE